MKIPAEKYWQMRLKSCAKALEANNFDTFVADSPTHARNIILNKILSGIEFVTVSWGDSVTFYKTGILEVLNARTGLQVIKTFDNTIPREEIIERRRQALLADLFFTGTNAVTETGKLVNLDMVGNRVAAITFGPKHVILVIGRNKIVQDVENGMRRIKDYAAPANAVRHDFRTPCTKTSGCMDCKSPQRLCNTWTITEKSYPKGRIKIVLINKDMGL